MSYQCNTCLDTGEVGILRKKKCPDCGGRPESLMENRPDVHPRQKGMKRCTKCHGHMSSIAVSCPTCGTPNG